MLRHISRNNSRSFLSTSLRAAALASLLLTAAAGLFPNRPLAADAGAAPAPDASAAPAGAARDKKFVKHSGETVKNRMEKLAKKNKALARAMKDFAKKGLSPVWEESLSVQRVKVEETARTGKPRFLPASFSAPQDVFVEGDKELTFITYDNSSFDQWDGIIYVRNGAADDTYTSNLVTPTDNGTNWDVVSEVYYPDSGEEPIDCRYNVCPIEPPAAQNGTGNEMKLMNASFAPRAASAPGFWGWVKRWWGCVGNVCGWSDFICTGRTRFICRVAYCVGGIFGCL